MEERGGKEPNAEDEGSNRRICVKLKLPKIHQQQEKEEEEIPSIIKRFECKECGKSFSSGKALGGHMSSAHVQANKDHQYSSSLKKINHKMMKRHSSVLEIKCMLCGRGFMSKKSLFGHMRCHPERQWRGMEPPPPPLPSRIEEDSSETESDDHIGEEDGNQNNSGGSSVLVEDIGRNLKGWATKRGRRPINPPPVMVSSEENKKFVAGQQLLRLINGNGNDEEDMMSTNGFKMDRAKLKIHEREAMKIHEREANSGNMEKEKKHEYKGNGKAKMLEPDQRTESTSPNDDDHIDVDCTELDEERLLAAAIGVLMSGGGGGRRDDNQKAIIDVEAKKMEPAAEVSSSQTTPPPLSPNLKENFICDICNRTFSTHQALGGHRSSHNKFRMSIVDLIDRHTPPPPPAAAIEEEEIEEEEDEEEEENETDVNMIESHEQQEQNGDISITRNNNILRSEERVVDFDLNMTPPEEQYDEMMTTTIQMQNQDVAGEPSNHKSNS